MNTWDEIHANWRQFKQEVRQHWDELSDQDLDIIAGRRDRLVSMLQDKYCLTRDAAEQQIDAFCSTCSGGAGVGELARPHLTGEPEAPPR